MAKRRAKKAKIAARKKAPARKRRVRRAVSAVKRAATKVRTVYKRAKATVKKHKRRKHGASSSGHGLNKPSGIITMAGLAIAGAIGGSMLASKIPIKSKKVQAGIPLLLGGGIAFTKLSKNPEMLGLALGLMAAGGLGMIRQFAPKVPLIAGEEDLLFPSSQAQKMLGYTDDLDGEEDIEGEWMNGQWMNQDDLEGEEEIEGEEIMLGKEVKLSGGWIV